MNLLAFMGRRLVFLVPTLLGVLAITFLISHIVPGDAAQLIAGPRATAEIIQRIRQDYGLDKPVYVQFGMYVVQVFRGDFGKSILTRRPVIADIRDFFPATFELTTMALFIAVLLGIPLGIISAVHRNKAVDQLSRVFSVTGVSMPIFWLGLLMMMVFYMQLSILPGPGTDKWGTSSLCDWSLCAGQCAYSRLARIRRRRASSHYACFCPGICGSSKGDPDDAIEYAGSL